MRTLTLFLLLAGLAVCQTTVNMPNSLTVSATATDALNKWLPTQTASTQTTLATPILAGATSITLASGAGIGANDAVLIDSEVFVNSAKNGATFTVTPGGFATAQANHSAGATVTLLKYPTFRKFFLSVLNEKTAAVMAQVGAAFDTYQTAVTNAKNTLDSAKNTAVQ